MPLMKQHDAKVGAAVPAAMAERLERVAPTATGRRSEFIRKAIEAELERVEAEQAAEQPA
jgi:metal-responsive CopG/Arc/MetJ family transcriptional regulator